MLKSYALQYWDLWAALSGCAKLGYTPDTRLMDLAATLCAADFQIQHFDFFQALAKLDYKPEASACKRWSAW